MNLEIEKTHRAIIRHSGHVLVKGGPGSGKTTIALLKAQAYCDKLKPNQGILFLSFSRAAIRQIIHRSKEVLRRDQRRLIEVRTYHRFCLEILQGHGRLLGGRSIRFVTPRVEKLMRSAFDGDWEPETRRLARDEGLYCFDQFARGAATVIKGSNAVRLLYGDRFPLIIVDEFQDTDEDQWLLIKALADVTELTCLADPEQCIFDFRPTVSSQYRINYARDVLAPMEFDLGRANHRSPKTGILSFADAVLRNKVLPTVKDVHELTYWSNVFESTLHFAVAMTFAKLRRQGIESPCVAVMTRSNSFVLKMSLALRKDHTYKGRALKSVPHEVVWDTDLASTSAEVVGSILEWSSELNIERVIQTLVLLSQYFRIKNVVKPTSVDSKRAEQFDAAAVAIREGKQPRIDAAKAIFESASGGIEYRGDPVTDWFLARDVLLGHKLLIEVSQSADIVRFFQLDDVLPRTLSSLWLDFGEYQGATARIREIMEKEQLLTMERDHRGCVLMTIHKSKGKEFDGVVLVEGNYVSRFFEVAYESPPFERSRRLLRVGFTRARNLVVLVRPSGATPLVDIEQVC